MEKLKFILLNVDHDDIEKIVIEKSDFGTKRNVTIKDYELDVDGEIILINGCASVDVDEYGGVDEPYYIDYHVDFDMTLQINNEDGDQLTASFCNIYEKPKLI